MYYDSQPIPVQEAGISFEKFRNTELTLRNKLGRIAVASLLAVGSSLGLAAAQEVVTAPSASAYTDGTTADNLGYPYYDATCEFAPNGGSSCTNPIKSTDMYDWGETINGSFQMYRNGQYEYRNCTDYVAWKLGQENVQSSEYDNLGNAYQWITNTPQSMHVASPEPGDVAVEPAGTGHEDGHVAYIENVNAVASNPLDDDITVSEYNHIGTGKGEYRTGTVSSMGFTTFLNFGADTSNSSPTSPTGGSTLGTFYNDTATNIVYEMVGNAPVRLGSWAGVGNPGVTPANVSDSYIQSLTNAQRYPADGTFVTDHASGIVYEFIGDAPLRIGTWAGVGSPNSDASTIVDDWSLQNVVPHTPADGDYFSDHTTGQVYETLGGSYSKVYSWSDVPAPHASTAIDEWTIQNILPPTPVDGTFFTDYSTGQVYEEFGGAATKVENWNDVGGSQPNVDIDHDALSDMRQYPADGTFANDYSTNSVYEFVGGSPVYLDSWSSIGKSGGSPANIGHVELSDDFPSKPADGTFINDYSTNAVYEMVGGAALYVSNWQDVGYPSGNNPVNVSDWDINNKYLSMPVNGTYIQGYQSGDEFEVVSQALVRVTSTPLPVATEVDDWTIVNKLGGTE